MKQPCSYPRHLKQTAKASIADVLASSWDDGSPSCSSSSLASTSEHCSSPSMLSSCPDQKASRAMRKPWSRQRGVVLQIFVAVALIMLHVAVPCRAVSTSEESQRLQVSSETYANAIRSFAKVVDTPPPPDPRALMPLLSRGEPVSIPKGCFRTSDLLSQSSVNPWSSALLSSGSEKPLTGRGLRSELVLCPLHTSSNDQQYRVFAVSGLLEVASEALPPPLMHGQAKAGAAPNAQVGIAVSSLREQATTSEASWPVVGHDNEGYWRQRDGKLEWDPQPTEPMPLVAPHSVPSASTVAPSEQSVTGVASPQRSTHSEGPPGNDHASAYDAWSASIGGEAAEEWLSFGAWKERHLAAEKEKEKLADAERRAERSRRAKQQQEQAAAAAASASSEGKQSSESIREQSSANDSKTSHSTAAEQRTAWSEKQTSPSGASSASLPSKGTTQSSVRASGHAASAVTPSESQKKISSANDRSSALPASSSTSSSTSSASSAATDNADDAVNAVRPAVRDTSSLLQTLRHRWNFASMDCAAVVHRTNPSAKFAASILSEKKDRYMLSPCPDISGDPHGNFVIVELCDEISIDTIVLANYEFFSRMFKRFRVSASQTLKSGSSSDSENWYQLGIFRARNLRGVQVFNTSLPQNFAAPSRFFRYLRIDFLEYYGNEHYCPLSLLRVYGLTQMDDYRREEEEERKALEEANLRFAIGEAEEDNSMPDEAGLLLESVPKAEDAPLMDLPEDSKLSSDSGLWDVLWKGRNSSPESLASGNQEGDLLLSESASDPESSVARENVATSLHAEAPPLHSAGTTPDSKPHSTPVAATPQRTTGKDSPASQSVSKQPSEASSKVSVNARQSPEAQTMINSSSLMPSASQTGDAPSKAKTEPGFCTAALSNQSFAILHSTNVAALMCPVSAHHSAVPTSSHSSAQSSPHGSSSAKSSAPDNISQSSGTFSAARQDKSSSSVSQSSVSSSESSSRLAQPSGSNAASGGSSESIYRTIAKRLNALEANATLSMQYIEHSGQMLRDIFRAMERRQETRLGDMLQALNASNWRQIEALKRRQQVDLQRAIFEFDVHKQQTETERRALMAEVRLLTSEVMFERRMGVVQLILVLGMVVFMMFTRGPSVSPSVLHSGLAKLSATASPRGAASTRKGSPLRPNGLFRSKSHGQGSEKTVSPLKPESKDANAPSESNLMDGSEASRMLARRSPVQQQSHGDSVGHRPKSSHATINHDNRKQPPNVRQERSERQQSAPAEISSPGGPVADNVQPPAGFAEMSPTELKAYLGLDSSRSASTSYDAPRQGVNGYQDETGDEGAETAMEDIEPNSDDALDEFNKMMKTDRLPSVHWASGQTQQRNDRESHFSPARILYRRAASAEPGVSLEDNSPRAKREIPASQGSSPLRKDSPRPHPPIRSDSGSRGLPTSSSGHQLADDKVLDTLNKSGAAVGLTQASNGTRARRSHGIESGPHQTPDSDASDGEAGSGSDAGGLPWQSVPLRRKSTQTGHAGQAAYHPAAGRADEGGSDVGHRSPGSVPLGRQRSANGRKSWVPGPAGGKGSVTPTGSGLGSSILLGESLHANRPARSASGSFVRSPASGHRARQPSLSSVKAPTPRSSSPLSGDGRRQSLTTLAGIAGGSARSTTASPLVPPYPSATKESYGNSASEAVGQGDWGQRHRSASATFVDKGR